MGILRRTRTVSAVIFTLGFLAVACSSGDSPPGTSGRPTGDRGDSPVVGLGSGAPVMLRSGDSCDEVAAEFRSLAADGVLADHLGYGRVVSDGMALAEEFAAGEGDDASTDAAAAPATTTAQGSAGSGTSDTNTQEAGIDEPDVVETDGEYVYLVDQWYDDSGEGERLVILDGASAEVVGRLPLTSFGTQLLLNGDRLLAISGGGYYGGPVAIDDAAVEPATEPGEDPVDGPEPLPLPTEPPDFPVGTTITLIDVSDPAAPTIVETNEIEGNHVSTRVVDGIARVVVSSYPDVQPHIEDSLYESNLDEAELRSALTEASQKAAEKATISDWLPSYRTTTVDEGDLRSVEGDAVPCTNVLMPDVNAGMGETSVLRIDFQSGFDPSATTTVVAEAHTVYASAQTLYIAATRYVSPQAQREIAPENWSTAIHAFDLAGDGAAPHTAAGEVPGNLLNQYSLSEHNGDLRVATTEGTPWGEQANSQSGVRVLRRSGDAFTEIGSVTGLGVTETIQSVRFMGDTGYVVTFRQTDPLYVIDLSDPANPRSVGELKIPGFSSYLHPIGEGRLIGLGRDADTEGRDQGLLISLFDVSDPANPRQIQTYTEESAHSPAGWDPKAFLWWAPESALAIPVERESGVVFDEESGEIIDESAYSYSSTISVFDVSDGGINLDATIDGPDADRYASRALVVQDRLWSLFTGGVAVSEFSSPGNATFHAFS